jgi:NAD(P)-dependent dehydrogenase (short-subunit alcohol dehydrogenase family)
MLFDGKVAIITGSARGLGRSYAERFVQDGASVVVTDVLEDALNECVAELEGQGGKVLPVVADVTDPDATAEIGRAAVGAFGRIDVLVNNAGIWGDLQRSSLLEIDPEYWDFVMDVNVRGPLLCARAVVPTMREQGSGSIINISSMGAYMPSGVYGVSKLALNQLTYALASELGPLGITVNAVAPGPIDNEASMRQVPSAAGWEKMLNGTLLKRLGSADDIYGMIRYLAGDDARWVTGQTYLVNGGYNSRL